MKHVRVDGSRCDFTVKSNFPNAIRRALLSDIETIAPDTVRIYKNTSCQPDEFIAHRIGLIPFKPINVDDADLVESNVLSVKDRTAMAHDLVSNSYVAYTDMPIMKMAPGQELKLSITFFFVFL